MLSYQHHYHAGNFADVHKHLALSLALRTLQRKSSALMIMDTHAGRGRYALTAPAAARTAEFRDGIGRLWAVTDLPPALDDYLVQVRACNPADALRVYPGSPLIARALLRSQDRLVLCERHPAEYQALRDILGRDRQVAVHRRDGFEALAALLPPREKRGLVLIDPSYEVKSEYRRVVEALVEAHRRWPQGRFLVWYPLLPAASHRDLLRRLARSGIRRILQSELQVRAPQDAPGLYGSGLLLVNPPWPLDDALAELTGVLAERLAQGESRAVTDWLVPE